MTQTFHLLRMSLATLPSHISLAAMVSVGIGSAVLVFISLLSIGAGIESMVVRNARADRVVVSKAGRPDTTTIATDSVSALSQLAGVRHAHGSALVSASLPIVLKARKHGDHVRTDINARGIDDGYFAVHPEVRLESGRRFVPGTYELIVGRAARLAYDGLNVGDEIVIRGARWKIVGSFVANEGIDETWLLGDLDTFRTAFKRTGPQEVTLILESPRAVERFRRELSSLRGQRLVATTDLELRQRQTRSLSAWANFVSYFVGAIMGVGAVVAASSALFAIVDHRRQITATLQAVGFQPASVCAALLLESLILATPGIAVGIMLPWVAINGMNASFVGLDFSLVVTPQLATTAVCAAWAVALAGAILPMIDGAKTSVAQALRA